MVRDIWFLSSRRGLLWVSSQSRNDGTTPLLDLMNDSLYFVGLQLLSIHGL